MDIEDKIIQLFADVAWDKSMIVRGCGDDAAVLAGLDGYQLLTKDLFLEKVHFDLAYSKPVDVGAKSLLVNISDIHAMGGIPTVALVGCAIPKHYDFSIIEGIASGMRRIAAKYGIVIIGGDTTCSNTDLHISVTLVGNVAEERIKYITGATAGDVLLVSEPTGAAALGLDILQQGNNQRGEGYIKVAEQFIHAQHLPSINRDLAGFLAARADVTSITDISDGLVAESWRLARASDVVIELDFDCFEYFPAMRDYLAANKADNRYKLASYLQYILHGGEDYKVLYTVAGAKFEAFRKDYISQFAISPLVIGRVGRGSAAVYWCDDKKRSLIEPQGFSHFK